jgi:hypothetical protein
MTKEERYAKFTADMEESNYSVEDYRGRNYYHGPAVRIDDGDELQDVIRATDVRVRWEALGRDGLIIFPR